MFKELIYGIKIAERKAKIQKKTRMLTLCIAEKACVTYSSPFNQSGVFF